jgi:YD repeat-containing protein
VTFFPQADGYKAGIGYHSSLERNEGNWDFYAKDGTRYHYSQRFRINFAPVTVLSPVYLEYIEDTNGNRTSLGYSPGGHRAPQLDFIRDSSGRQINLEYLAIQQLAAIASGGLNEDGSPIDPEDIKNIKPSAVNDLYGFPRNVITRVTGLGYDIAYDYDENGRLVEATNYQDRGNLSEELPEGESITEVYQYQDITDLTPDFPGLGFDVQTATAIEAIIDPRGIKTDYSYIRRERELLLALNGNEFTLPYTSAVVQVTEISKTDDLNLPINNANDIVSKLEYFDRLSSDELPTVEITDPRNVLYRHTMDLVGRGVQVDGPTGSRFMSWTPNDTLMLSETDENGVLKEYQYDQDGNQTQERVSGLNGDSFTTTSRYQREGYNGTIRNLIRSRTDRRGNTTDYDYDVRGNLKTITHPSTVEHHFPIV